MRGVVSLRDTRCTLLTLQVHVVTTLLGVDGVDAVWWRRQNKQRWRRWADDRACSSSFWWLHRGRDPRVPTSRERAASADDQRPGVNVSSRWRQADGKHRLRRSAATSSSKLCLSNVLQIIYYYVIQWRSYRSAAHHKEMWLNNNGKKVSGLWPGFSYL